MCVLDYCHVKVRIATAALPFSLLKNVIRSNVNVSCVYSSMFLYNKKYPYSSLWNKAIYPIPCKILLYKNTLPWVYLSKCWCSILWLCVKVRINRMSTRVIPSVSSINTFRKSWERFSSNVDVQFRTWYDDFFRKPTTS